MSASSLRTAFVVIVAISAFFQPPGSPALAAGRRTGFEDHLRRSVTIKGREHQHFGLTDRMAYYRVPGVGVAVIDRCRIVDRRSFGELAAGGPQVNVRTRFQAASISKSLTAVAALRLVELHRLALDADVRPYLQRWRLPDDALLVGHPVTLRFLLNHSAGINVEGFPGYRPDAQLPVLAQILAGVAPANTPAVHVESVPGTRWNYSGGGYLIVQAMMSDVTGEDFDSLMGRLVLRPLRMENSSFEQPPGRTIKANVARGTSANGVTLPFGWNNYPELAAAGLWTTPSDLARFVIALGQSVRGKGGGLLSPQSAADLMTRGPGNWGLGVDLGPRGAARQFGHTGSNLGYQSAYIFYPDTCQGAVVMTNADDPGQLLSEILRAIGDHYDWPDRKSLPVTADIPLSDPIRTRFIGRWMLRDFPAERFSISQKPDGGLSWARDGHIGRDLLVENSTRLFSPDSHMTLTVQPGTGPANAIALEFGAGANVAVRTN